MLDRYLPFIEKLPDSRELKKEDLLTPDFLIEKEKNLEMYYSPHNDYINKQAAIIIVGITPGWTQTKTAYETFGRLHKKKLPLDKIMKETKKAASFSGTMRANLITMLDECKLNHALGTSSTSSLFAENRSTLHTTSMIKYPVFYKGKNYTGHQPKLANSDLLSSYSYHLFAKEIRTLPSSSLIIPLGKRVEAVIAELKQQGKITQVCLQGFPHPSGANGHRITQFNKNKNSLLETVANWEKSGG
ncbi:hypothetical protein F9U64_10440 [Gracilibacillus oryzae]|uniref:Uracil-DNA glycosylase-like domain-containing protein n=1 Tax=Gracilibacillus oryzae TaxID=1672701 RepID=A0A7C8KQ74_9BACI|nr:hypothetical protein [Gracilibacillus oryzae]KAB8136225.1 hypothetical protein F9U64_10440 [Gracilibacillus oryzae]